MFSVNAAHKPADTDVFNNIIMQRTHYILHVTCVKRDWREKLSEIRLQFPINSFGLKTLYYKLRKKCDFVLMSIKRGKYEAGICELDKLFIYNGLKLNLIWKITTVNAGITNSQSLELITDKIWCITFEKNKIILIFQLRITFLGFRGTTRQRLYCINNGYRSLLDAQERAVYWNRTGNHPNVYNWIVITTV